ncbi:hypothetical protein TIFTF001_032813 [Ficus carica]|uniref:Uncharacterized protein n=1 Tax=Ficus carica TaxID=3494 RepID=A0AA88DX10_FICCA|nr:hypothetical protein TIFTF001_032813 [Ficus carica]
MKGSKVAKNGHGKALTISGQAITGCGHWLATAKDRPGPRADRNHGWPVAAMDGRPLTGQLRSFVASGWPRPAHEQRV